MPEAIEDLIKRKAKEFYSEILYKIKTKPSPLTPFATSSREGFMSKKIGSPLIKGAQDFRKTSEILKKVAEK